MTHSRASLALLPAGLKPGFLSLEDSSLASWLEQGQESPYRTRQIAAWILEKRALSFEQMTDLPARLRDSLVQSFNLFSSRIDCHKVSLDDTNKLLLQLEDGNRVECVLMKEETRRTVCVSTQVGCAMGCVFCASGIDGVVRNLRPHEILEQMIHARNLLPKEERLTHVVVMGMGEPLTNLEALLEALALACSPKGLGLGARNVTISTVGLPVQIRKLADLKKTVSPGGFPARPQSGPALAHCPGKCPRGH